MSVLDSSDEGLAPVAGRAKRKPTETFLQHMADRLGEWIGCKVEVRKQKKFKNSGFGHGVFLPGRRNFSWEVYFRFTFKPSPDWGPPGCQLDEPFHHTFGPYRLTDATRCLAMLCDLVNMGFIPVDADEVVARRFDKK